MLNSFHMRSSQVEKESDVC